jgi:hypothetical protein
MKSVLNAKPLSAGYVKKIDKYFKSKSQLFDTFDEIFLHIGFIIDGSKREPSELVELAIEDIVFENSHDLQKHVSEYFFFHNSIVKFLDLLESAKDSDEIVEKTKKVASALYALCDDNLDIFQDRLAQGAVDIIDTIFDSYEIEMEGEDLDLLEVLSVKIPDVLAAKTLANVMYSVPVLQDREFGKKEAISTASTILLMAMMFNYLRKENKIKT